MQLPIAPALCMAQYMAFRVRFGVAFRVRLRMAFRVALRMACRTGFCIALCVLSSCSSSPSGDSLFPLEAGRQWTYRVTTSWEDQRSSDESLTLKNIGKDRPAGLAQAAWHRRSDQGADYWLQSDTQGVYRIASKNELEAEAQPDPAPRFVLKAPVAVGTQWQASTVPYVLMRQSEFPRELRHSHPRVTMLYQIDALDTAIDTPAGRFEHCVRVKGSASIRVFADPVSGWRDMPLNTLEWYCPGIGLARLERHEPAKSAFLVGGVLTMELMAWR